MYPVDSLILSTSDTEKLLIKVIIVDPYALNDGQVMNDCGNHTYCCNGEGPNYSTSCCGGDVFRLDQVVVSKEATVQIVSVHTVRPNPLTNTLLVTVTPTHTDSSQGHSITSKGKFPRSLSRESSTVTLQAIEPSVIDPPTNTSSSMRSSKLQTLPTSSTYTSLASPGTMASSTLQSSTSTSLAEHHGSKTSLGFEISLCLILGLLFTGALIWFIRRQRRKHPSKKTLHISSPISDRTNHVPMSEVANTDWEMPVDREMPAEMSTNRRTEQNWI